MKHRTPLMIAAILVLTLTTSALADSAHFKTLYSFKGAPDGETPSALVMDSLGNIYGTTLHGGGRGKSKCSRQCGTVFQLSLDSNGTWKKKTIYAFKGEADGAEPNSLLLSSDGNLYGTALSGDGDGCGGAGCGTVFRLSPSGTAWTETTIHRFHGGPDNGGPFSLVQDRFGYLWGGTTGGFFFMCHECKYGPNWTEFPFSPPTAASSVGPLMVDPTAGIIGTTSAGGDLTGDCEPVGGCGTIWASNGGLFEILFFDNTETGFLPRGPLFKDSDGDFFGVTEAATKAYGTVYQLAPRGRRVIHRFDYAKGAYPESGVVQDTAGALYGTTAGGGNPACGSGTFGCGVVYKLTTSKAGGWSETVLHEFTGTSDGSFPGQVIIDAAGNLYAPTQSGGSTNCDGGCGTIFEVTP